MTATLTAPVEAFFHVQVAKGHFPSMDRALEVAVKAVDGRRNDVRLQLSDKHQLRLLPSQWQSGFSEQVFDGGMGQMEIRRPNGGSGSDS
jgi:hypothetical protein